jgi:putative hydrolase of the HAD superfamily
VFHEQRSFSRGDFRDFMFEQSKPYPEALDLFRELRKRPGLKLAAISNETRELAEYRIRKFDLGAICDFFVVSSFVHLRKPDPDIFRMALDLAQTTADRTVYLEDRYPFVEVAGSLGLRAIHHTGIESTRRALRDLGLG